MPPSHLLRNILFPTDFSRSSEAIIDHVVGLASAFNAKVWLLSVIPPLAYFNGVSESYSGPLSEAALVRVAGDRKLLDVDRLQSLERLQKNYFSPVQSEICVKSAGVAESIVEDDCLWNKRSQNSSEGSTGRRQVQLNSNLPRAMSRPNALSARRDPLECETRGD